MIISLFKIELRLEKRCQRPLLLMSSGGPVATWHGYQAEVYLFGEADTMKIIEKSHSVDTFLDDVRLSSSSAV
jgi:hypothetical protein